MNLLPSLVTPVSQPPEGLLDALVRTMMVRDEAMNEHGHHVQRYALALAMASGITDRSMIESIDAASLLHDIGKLGIPDTVLQKAGPLTLDEYELVKRHVVIGADLLSAVAFPDPIAIMVRHHHENWDGTGYPDRLRGADIPLGARVLAIADCYDALTSDRPYRGALTHARAIAIIAACRGTMYDPTILDAFLGIVHQLNCAPSRALPDSLDTDPAWMPLVQSV